MKAAIGTATGEAAVKARTAIIAAIEKAACPDTATTRCQVVTLYGGGQYKLYTYRKYSDVRIVWAPEAAASTFGGDPDNYNFPRYALDGAFLRAYENGQPVATPQHLKWTAREPKEGEVIFVVGNPGSTQRLLTQSQFAFQREVNLPITLASLSELRGRLISAMRQNPDKAREGEQALNGIENDLKRAIGRTRALGDPRFSAMLAANEAALRAKSAGNAAIGDPWGEIDRAMAELRAIDAEIRYSIPDGVLMNYALTLVRAAAERAKPNGERLPGYSDSALPLKQKQLLDARPVTPWLDALRWNGRCPRRANISVPTIPRRGFCSARSRRRVSPLASCPAAARRSGGAQGAVGRRRGGDRRLDRPDDRLRENRRRQRAAAAENL